MFRLIITSIALAACTAPPATYERGTLTRQPPAEARPGVGAPTYDPQARPLPPQPQPKPTRVLPQTPETRREPGIWATEDPAATNEPPDWKAREPIVWGVRLPEPDDVDERSREVYRTQNRVCASIIDRFDAKYMNGAALRASDTERRCLVMRFYGICALVAKKDRDALKRSGTFYSRDVSAVVDWHWGTARERIDTDCTPNANTPWVDDWFNRLVAGWNDVDWRNRGR